MWQLGDEELRGKAKSESPGPGRKVINVGRNNLKKFSGSLSGSRVAGISHNSESPESVARDSEIAMSPRSDLPQYGESESRRDSIIIGWSLQAPASVLPVGGRTLRTIHPEATNYGVLCQCDV